MIYVYTSKDHSVGPTDMGSGRSILHRKDNLWLLNRETVTGEGRGLVGGAETSLASEIGRRLVRMADWTSDVLCSVQSKWLGYKNFTEPFSPPPLLSC